MTEADEPDRSSDPPSGDGSLLDTAPELELLAHLLAEGRSDAEAALWVGRSAKFLQRTRKSNPAFVAHVKELKQQRATATAAAFGSLLEEAVATVHRALHADRTADQLRAASLIFENYRSFRSESEAVELVADLRSEVEALRDALDAVGAQTDAEASS